MFLSHTTYTPDPSFCDNKWCNNSSINVPATGMMHQVAKCGNYSTMLRQLETTGGRTGRGVTPCDIGYLEQTPWTHDKTILIPFQQKDYHQVSKNAIFFDPERPSFLPAQSNPRPMTRIGYTWRN
jgi:hypothetical protein